MIDLSNKTILVTGASGTGVGAGIAEALYLGGANVIIHDLNEQKFTQELKAKYAKARFIAGDLASDEAIQGIFEKLKQEHIVLDGLVNNAGVGLSKPANEVSKEEYAHLFNVDVKAVWLLSKYFVDQCIEHRIGGSIVNVSSVHAHATIPRYAIYAGAKANVEGMTRGFAVDFGKYGIRANAIAPGYVHSDQNYDLIRTWCDDPKAWVNLHSKNQQCIEREVSPIECGYLAAFLLSDLSPTITGQVIPIDGGTTALLYNKDFL